MFEQFILKVTLVNLSKIKDIIGCLFSPHDSDKCNVNTSIFESLAIKIQQSQKNIYIYIKA